jgi:outer membrane protein
MAIRSNFFLVFLFLAALTICGQESASFPGSKPYREQLAESGPVREISLHDALATALMQNLDIEIENYNRDLNRAATVNALSYYDPLAGLNTSLISSDLPVTSVLQTGASNSQITRSWSVAPSIQQNLPGGGTATLSVNLSRTSTNSIYAFVDPAFGSSIGIIITQPLWRGFRRTAAERQITVSRLNERMGESQFRQKVTGIVEQVINAYWRLAVTMENYEAQRQARDVAVLQYEQTRRRRDAGQETSLALTSARSDAASHEQTLTQAAVQIIQAANTLKRQLAPSVMDPLWADGLITADRPELKEPSVGLQEAVKTALERRPELEQLRLQLEQSDAELRFARQETKPAINLRLEAASTGSAGIVYALSSGLVVSRALDPSSPWYGGLGKAYGQAARFQYPSLAAGLEVKLPLRNRAANSQLATTVVGARKLQSQLQAAQEDILVEVRNAWESMAAQKKNVESASLSRRLAEEQLAVETAKGSSDTEKLELLRGQRDLADARVHELQALIDYDLAGVSLERAMNTLVDEEQVLLARRK